MKYALLGSTGLNVSRIAFGAGPVPALLTARDPDAQRATVKRALEAGINWFDTAATYGGGQSESNLGTSLAELGALDQVFLATKVRLMPEQLADARSHVRQSVLESLRRLRVERMTLLQLHNSVTARAGAQPTSLTPAHVLDPGGVLEEMVCLQEEGLVEHLGLTALGEPSALRAVIASNRFATVQVPYNLLNPSAGVAVPESWKEDDYGNVIAACGERRMGVFAIRVFAGGALVGKAPSAHTLTTKFFPLDLYERDRRRAARLEETLPNGMTLKEAAVRFALAHPQVTSAIVGFSDPAEVSEVSQFDLDGPLSAELSPNRMADAPAAEAEN